MKAKANLFRTLLVLPVVVLVAVAVALFGVGIRSAETQTTPSYYKVQDLGILGGSRSYASAINDSGQVVGYSYTAGDQAYHAFLYDSTNGTKDLGTLGGTYSEAKAINKSGQVVGWSDNSSGERRAFLYDSSNGMKDLNDLFPADSARPGYIGLYIEEATAINSDGKIAVQDYFGSFLLAPATTATSATYEVQHFESLGNDYSYIYATGINDVGQVVGFAANWDNGDRRAFLYDESATPKMQDLGGYYSEATDINDSGQVVGYALFALNGLYAFLYDSTNGIKDLGTLGGTYSEAGAINKSGRVVGRSDNSSGERRAFIYDSTNGMKDLNTLIPPDSGWTIQEATAINTDGEIAATGYKSGAGQRALLLTPTSDTPPADSEAPSPPTITSPKTNTYDSDGSFSISGSAEPGSTVELFEGTTSKGTTTADSSSSGAWSIDLSGVSEGAHTYFAKAKDAAGNTSSASDSVTVTVEDKTAPGGTVSINNGDTRTRSRSVTLTLSATDPSPGSGVTQMRISNTESGLSSASWADYSTSKAWTLTVGTGTKTVYVQYRDGAGNDSAVVKDTITYKP